MLNNQEYSNYTQFKADFAFFFFLNQDLQNKQHACIFTDIFWKETSSAY